MEQPNQYASDAIGAATEETSIFDELKPLPVYYSTKAIYAFTILVGVLFGSIMMAINCNNTPSKKGVWQIIVFGVLFTAAQFYALSLIGKSANSGAIVFNFIGAAVLKQYFWDKYIGNVPYSKKPVWIPVIIAVVLVALVVLAMLYRPTV